MKLITTSILFVLMLIGINAQNTNMIFFTEGGEKFTLYLNGVQVNEIPLTNVKAEGINMEMTKIRIVFETPGIPELTKGFMLEPNMEMTAVIKKNNKGKYVLRPAGSVPLLQAESSSETVASNQMDGSNTNTSINTTTTTTSTNTTVNPDVNNNAQVAINFEGGETGYNMNVNMNINDGNTQYTESSVTTTTVTTTSSYSESGYSEPDNQPALDVREGCTIPMSSFDYAKAKKSIENKTYAKEKITILNQVLNTNCVSVNQVIGFMKLFTYEDDKLTVAKNAYKKTVDQSNYYQVNDAFTYSSSVDDLNRFIESQ